MIQHNLNHPSLSMQAKAMEAAGQWVKEHGRELAELLEQAEKVNVAGSDR